MTLTITDTTITSGHSPHAAGPAPDRNGWEVSWLPGRTLDRNTAITAMTLADTTTEPGLREGHHLWPFIQSWAQELGLTAPDAIPLSSQPPGGTNREQEPDGRLPD